MDGTSGLQCSGLNLGGSAMLEIWASDRMSCYWCVGETPAFAHLVILYRPRQDHGVGKASEALTHLGHKM